VALEGDGSAGGVLFYLLSTWIAAVLAAAVFVGVVGPGLRLH
jgi:hypothetical protein